MSSNFTTPPGTSIAAWAASNPTDPTHGQPAIIAPSSPRYANGFGFAQYIPRQFMNWLFNYLTIWSEWFRASLSTTDTLLSSLAVSIANILIDMGTMSAAILALTNKLTYANIVVPAYYYLPGTPGHSTYSANVTVRVQKQGKLVTLYIPAFGLDNTSVGTSPNGILFLDTSISAFADYQPYSVNGACVSNGTMGVLDMVDSTLISTYVDEGQWIIANTDDLTQVVMLGKKNTYAQYIPLTHALPYGHTIQVAPLFMSYMVA